MIPVGRTETDEGDIIRVGRKEQKMKSYIAKPADIERKWYVIDAEGKTLGRLASEAAAILRGKKKPIYTPHVDTGDYVIVINTDKMILTGNKGVQKKFYRYSGFPGGLKEFDYKTLMATKSDFVLEKAVKGMLPKNSLGKDMASKLKVYKGSEHPHEAQKPRQISIKGDVK